MNGRSKRDLTELSSVVFWYRCGVYLWAMKWIPLLLVLTLISSRADEPVGMRFFAGSWQQALTESQRLGKPLFVEFYANWCPPCHRMAREAFPNPAIGNAFNPHFINYRIDAEIGEGPELAKRFAVGSFPTTLYFTPTGDIAHRAVGYAGVNSMIQQVKLVLKMPPMRRAIRQQRRRS